MSRRAARSDQPGDRRRHRLVQTEGAAEERAPREEDRDQVGEAVELGRQSLDAVGEEDEVGEATTRRPGGGAT